MKFDKDTLIVMIVCAILLCFWHVYFGKPAEQEKAAAQTAPAVEQVQPAEQQPVPEAVPAPAPVVVKPVENGTPVSAENSLVSYDFNAEGLLKNIEIRNAKRTQTDENLVVQEPAGYEPFSWYIDGFQMAASSVRKDGQSVIAERLFRKDGEAFLLRMTFVPSDKTPAMDCTAEFLPVQGAKAPVLSSVILWAGSLPPLKQFSNDDLRDIHRAEYMTVAGKTVDADPSAKKAEKFLSKKTTEPVAWISVYNKYFISQLFAETPFNGGCELTNNRDAGYDQPGIGGVYKNVTVPSSAFKFKYYTGAKDVELMTEMPKSCLDGIHMAYWGWLEPLCRPMLSLLNLLKSVTGSYGLAIILLTVLVKLVLWPLIHRGNKSMRRMQKIQPVIKELKEKYKDDQQTFNQEMWKVYRENKVNPIGGCFPMLLQFPVFVALYSTLESAVQLRHVPFLWAADLSRPDAVGPAILGISIHPLMLLSTGLMILQMKIQPQTGDPAQRKMMMFMPLIMLIFFYNFPSGLALYWTVNNILSILQMKYSQYAARKEDERNEQKPQSPDSKAGRRAGTAKV